MAKKCPACKSKRIINARHDSDWGGSNMVHAVNPASDYDKGDLSPEGDVQNFGDINIFVCLNCGFAWQTFLDMKYFTIKYVFGGEDGGK